jgi:NAD(P)-dependent dehydrogenase (short-subunit alcohol dehydrogenase family)
VADAGAIGQAVADAVRELGGLDIVFANAGVTGGYGPISGQGNRGRLENLDLALWQRTIDINLTGIVHTLQAAVPALKAEKAGKIVVTASIAGLRANAAIGYPYTASKTALVGLVKELALELAEFDIQVNGLAPGPFKTNINDRRFHDPVNAAIETATVPQRRLAEPEEIKGLAILLASGASSFITGAVIPIDGGKTAGSPALSQSSPGPSVRRSIRSAMQGSSILYCGAVLMPIDRIILSINLKFGKFFRPPRMTRPMLAR